MGEETVALVTGPFCRCFLRSNDYPNCAVSVLLVPVEVVYVVLSCLNEEDGGLDFLNSAFPLMWRGIGDLRDYVFERLRVAWLMGV